LKSIEANKGKLVVKESARTVSERDDRLLAEKMEALENANKVRLIMNGAWRAC
jgi:translation initiation factor 2 subunit 1